VTIYSGAKIGDEFFAHSHVAVRENCRIGNRVLLQNGVTIGAGSIVAAGTLITERTAIPAGSLVMGSPGKVKRMLTGIDQAAIDEYAKRYVSYKNIYREEPTE